MNPPSYAQRRRRLHQCLSTAPSGHAQSAFQVAGRTDGSESARKDAQLDELLLQSWTGRKNERSPGEHALDGINHLRLQTTDFSIIGRAGDGQFGTVDAARCSINNGIYAIKTISKIAAVRAGPVRQILVQLLLSKKQQLALAHERHLHILATVQTSQGKEVPAPRLIAAFQDEETFCAVLDYAPCGTLWDRLCSDPASLTNNVSMSDTETIRPLPIEELRWCGSQMVQAIAWVHSAGFAHRDIKPHNFLITPPYRILLTDFGSACPLLSTTHPHIKFRPGAIHKDHCALAAGTPDYVSPEVLQMAEDAALEAFMGGEDDPDQTVKASAAQHNREGYDWGVDWWSLGSTLFEMATGQAPFWARTVEQTYRKISNHQAHLHFPASVPADLRSLLQSLLQPASDRLGRDAAAAVSSHLFFDLHGTPEGDITLPKSMEPFKLTVAALMKGISPPPIRELADPKSKLDLTLAGTGSFGELTFSHFFQQSSIITADSRSEPSDGISGHEYRGDWHRWVGWTWHPPPSVFEDPPDFDIPLVSISRRETPSHVTPVRPSSRPTLYATPIPGSAARTRPISERRAFAELLECVQSSAKKRASVKRPSVGDSPFPRQARVVMPTPTPATRLQRPLSRQSTMLLESPPQASRPLSDVTNLSDLEQWHENLESSLKDLDDRFSRLSARFSSPAP